MEYHSEWSSHTHKIIDGEESTKPEKEWDEVDKKLAQLNAKAMNVLYCALDVSEFNHISKIGRAHV